MGSVGIVGLGKQAEEYIHVIKNISGWVIKVVCDQDPFIASKIASELNCSFSTLIEDMVTIDKCDIYLLCLPHNQYFKAMSILAYPNCHVSQCAKPEQNYDVEDTAHILLEYTSPFNRDNFVCSTVISRCYGNKQEEVRLVGTK
ncbi:MAG: hypothetical protein H6R25_4401 [Proteobacteria bacterium]|nr:hypothetical protein [Pseudomonadota bacterium]